MRRPPGLCKVHQARLCVEAPPFKPSRPANARAVCDTQNQDDNEDGGMDFSNVDEMYAVFSDRLEAVDNAAPAAPLHVKHGKGAHPSDEREAG